MRLQFAENGAEAYLASLKRVEALLLSHVQHQSVINISDVHAVCQSDLLGEQLPSRPPCFTADVHFCFSAGI